MAPRFARHAKCNAVSPSAFLALTIAEAIGNRASTVSRDSAWVA
jgi:hypothetical protein